MSDRQILRPTAEPEEVEAELSLRPRWLKECIGQDKVKANLAISIAAAKRRGEPLDHILFYGPPGLGKTTFAVILANEMGAQLRVTSGPAITIPGDLAAIITSLAPGDAIFIDEIHRLSRIVEEALYPAMEDYVWDMVLGKGMAAKSIRLRLPKFTMIGATTRYSMLSSPLRDRFGSTYRLDFFEVEAIRKIVIRSAAILEVPIDEAGAGEIARRARGTPRIANRLLRRVRDYAQVKADGRIDRQVADEALAMLEVDELGLDDIDRKALAAIIDKFDGGPVGIETVAAAISEEPDTVMDVYEPYLLQLGFLARTPRGRVATELAYRHLGRPSKKVEAPAQPRLL